MKPAVRLCIALLAFAASPVGLAADFEFSVDAPKFRVTLPSIPAMKMETHPMHATNPHLRYLGIAGKYTVAIFTPAAAAGMTALECAAATVRSLAARKGVPPAADILKARLNDNTFVAMYATPLDPGVQLHAHFLSAAHGTHCIEVHAAMVSTSMEDLAPWVDGFDKARIDTD